MVEEATISDQTVCRSNQFAKDGKTRGVLSKDFSEEECVLILEDEELLEQPVCEARARQTVRLFKEYQGRTELFSN